MGCGAFKFGGFRPASGIPSVSRPRVVWIELGRERRAVPLLNGTGNFQKSSHFAPILPLDE